MPCDSSYLEPNSREKAHQEAAILYLHLLGELRLPVPDWVAEEAENIYAGDARLFPDLCATLTGLGAKGREDVIYGDAHNPMARRLADWWEEHEAADMARREREESEAAVEAARRSAASKLTDEERRAVGLE